MCAFVAASFESERAARAIGVEDAEDHLSVELGHCVTGEHRIGAWQAQRDTSRGVPWYRDDTGPAREVPFVPVSDLMVHTTGRTVRRLVAVGVDRSLEICQLGNRPALGAGYEC